MSYNDKLDPDEQVSAEEAIAARIFDFFYEEEDAAQLGREILYIVLRKFRSDLIAPTPEEKRKRLELLVSTNETYFDEEDRDALKELLEERERLAAK